MRRKRQIVFVATYLFVALIGLGSNAMSACDVDHSKALKACADRPILFTMVKIAPNSERP